MSLHKIDISPLRQQLGGNIFVLLCAFLLALSVVQEDIRFMVFIVLPLLLVFSVLQQRILLYIFVTAYIWFYSQFWYAETPLLYIGVNVYIGDLFLLLFSSSTIFLFLSRQGHPALHSKLVIAITLYLVWGLFSIIRGIPVWGHSAVGESRFVMWSCAYFPVVYCVRNMNDFKKFLFFFFVLLLSYLLYLQTWRFVVEYRGDIVSMLSSKRLMSADLALLVVSTFAFSMTFVLTGAAGKYKLLPALIAVITGAMVPFGARTGWVAFAASIVFITYMTLWKRGLSALIFLLVLIGILAMVFVNLNLFEAGSVLDPQVEEGLGFTTEAGRLYGTTAWRLIGWRALVGQTLRGNPIFGEGFGGYYDVFELELRGVPPHNDWLVIFSKMGLVGLALFMGIVIQFYRIGFRFLRETTDLLKQAFMQGLMATFLVGLIGGTFFFFFPFMWVTVGLHAALVNISQTESIES